MNDARDPELSRAREFALRLLDYRDRSESELRERLARKGFSPGSADEVLAGLKRLGLVDDERFARLWVRSRLSGRPRAGFLLGLELARKGVSRNIIEATLAELLPPERERALAAELARRQAGRYRGDDPETARRKLWAYLGRRGFRAEQAEEAIKDIDLNECTED